MSDYCSNLKDGETQPEENENVETDNLYGKDSAGREITAPVTKPFDPKEVNIITQTYVVVNLVERLRNRMIDLEPDFQRFPNLWSDEQQSRLIESMIIRIPIPTFYFDEDADNRITVVDGLQRLNAINRFMALPADDPHRLRLSGLEYLPIYDGKLFEELPLSIQMRIRETNLTAYVIRPGTPEPVVNSIFTRINTGGIQLTPAEIRNSVYRGQAAELLKRLAHSSEFVEATGHRVKPDRMMDCELVNRFLAFYILDLKDYKENLEDFLNEVLLRLKRDGKEQLERYEAAFKKSMKLCIWIFGDTAFRKIQKDGKYGRINKPLFECVSVLFARCTDKEQQKLLENKEIFLEAYRDLLHDPAFVESITMGTARIENVKKRYAGIRKAIEETTLRC